MTVSECSWVARQAWPAARTVSVRYRNRKYQKNFAAHAQKASWPSEGLLTYRHSDQVRT